MNIELTEEQVDLVINAICTMQGIVYGRGDEDKDTHLARKLKWEQELQYTKLDEIKNVFRKVAAGPSWANKAAIELVESWEADEIRKAREADEREPNYMTQADVDKVTQQMEEWINGQSKA